MTNFQLLNNALNGRLTATEFLVYYVIINTISMRKTERVKIYTEYLSDKANLSPRQIQRVTTSLAEKGFIKKEVIQRNRFYRECYYSLPTSDTSKIAPTSVQNEVDGQLSRSDQENTLETTEIALNEISDIVVADVTELDEDVKEVSSEKEDVKTPIIEYITESEQKERLEAKARILIEKMKLSQSFQEYNEMMKKYEKWLGSQTEDYYLKHKLLKMAQGVMDSVKFNQKPIEKAVVIIDTPKVAKIEKRYLYKGKEAQDEEITLKECIERGLEPCMLFDTVNRYFSGFTNNILS